MIPPNYVPSDPSRESERTKAARALVVECVGNRNKIAMRPRDSSDMPAPGVIYTEEINRYLAARGFDDYTVEYNATGPAALGHFVLLARPGLPGPRGPSLPRDFLTAEDFERACRRLQEAGLTIDDLQRAQERIRAGESTMDEANRMIEEKLGK